MRVPTVEQVRAAKAALATIEGHEISSLENVLSACWRNWDEGPENIREFLLVVFAMGLMCRDLEKEDKE